MQSIGSLRAVFSFAGAIVLTATLMVPATAVFAASGGSCRVKNINTGVVKPGLWTAIRAARNGHELRVRGTCKTSMVIRKNVTIRGVWTKSSGKAALVSSGGSPVISVGRGAKVAMKKIVVRGAPYFPHGSDGIGIENRGRLVLRNVVVRDNEKGGIKNYGVLELRGKSSIRDNAADKTNGIGIWNLGGRYASLGFVAEGELRLYDSSSISGTGGVGIRNYGTASTTMNDRSSVNRNSPGGGIWTNGGLVKLKDSSTIWGNKKSSGAGIWAYGGSVKLKGSSVIRGNEATWRGGGLAIRTSERWTLTGARCGSVPDANVYDNTVRAPEFPETSDCDIRPL